MLIYFEGHGFISILYRQVPASKNKFYYYYYRHAHSAQWHFQWLPIYALIFADGCIFCCISTGRWGFPRILSFSTKTYLPLACENIRFSSFFTTRDVLRGWTSATQQQKLHTDDPIQCLHNKSRSHGVLNTNLSSFRCPLVDFGEVLCSSANELQQNSNAFSREDHIPQILTVLLTILRVYIWPLWPFVCHS